MMEILIFKITYKMDVIIPRYNFFALLLSKKKINIYIKKKKSPDVDKNAVLFALFWGNKWIFKITL